MRKIPFLNTLLADGDQNRLRDYFWQQLTLALGDGVVLNGHPTKRLPSTVSVSFPGYVGSEILAKLDGVYASTGAACHTGGAKPSRVLTAMGFPLERAIGTIRFSVGRPTQEDEINRVVYLLTKALDSRVHRESTDRAWPTDA